VLYRQAYGEIALVWLASLTGMAGNAHVRPSRHIKRHLAEGTRLGALHRRSRPPALSPVLDSSSATHTRLIPAGTFWWAWARACGAVLAWSGLADLARATLSDSCI